MKLMIRLIKPHKISPMLKTGFAEWMSDTLPQSKRNEPNVTPYEFCRQLNTLDSYIVVDTSRLGEKHTRIHVEAS